MTQIGAPGGRGPGGGGLASEDDDLWVDDGIAAGASADAPADASADASGTATRGGSTDARTSTAAPWPLRDRLVGFGIATAGVLAVVATMVHAGVAFHEDDFGSSWQLIERGQLTRDPLGSVWYLHIQPPLHNLVIGSVLRWSPFPAMGTIFVLYVAALVGLALLLTDLLARWRVHPAAAGAITAFALVNPNLLSTIGVASYEVPVALLVVGSVWWFQRQLQRPGFVPLLGLSATLTALAMTRSLFHPAFVVAVVVLAAVARRIAWQQVAVAVAIPVLVIGGWMVKNDILFGTPTLSSWLGFNLQRGVVAPMAKADVDAAVQDGTVTSLAQQYPWGELGQYRRWLDGCRPVHANPAVSVAVRPGLEPRIANFNDECYLPLYAESQQNAEALIKRYPGRYLRTRVTVLSTSFAMAKVGVGESDFAAPGRTVINPTWMDRVADVLLVRRNYTIAQSDWNLPLLGGSALPASSSLTLAALALGLLLRGILAAFRLARSGWRDRATTWDTDELVWLFVAAAGILVILVGDLIEFGENGRFRAMLDPLLVALPLAAAARIGSGLLARRRASERPPPPEPVSS